MFKLLSSFTFNQKQGFLYKRAGNLYYSSKELGKEVESSKFLTHIQPNIKLSDFLLTLT